MAWFFPEAHAGIDWACGYDFLDQELAQVTQDAELGRRRVDKWVRVTPAERYRWKWRLLRGLYERGFAREDVVALFHFLDWL